MFGDSLEVDANDDASTSAEPLPMKSDISRVQIWIPSQALPNRQNTMNPNENVPTAHRTLEQPKVADKFSFYEQAKEEMMSKFAKLKPLLEDIKNNPALFEALKKHSRPIPKHCKIVAYDYNKIMQKIRETEIPSETNGLPIMINLDPISDYYVDLTSEEMDKLGISKDQIKTKECQPEPNNSSITDADSLNEIYNSNEEENKSLLDVEIKKSYEQLHCETVTCDSDCLGENEHSNVETFNKSLEQVKENPVKNQNVAFDELQNEEISEEKLIDGNISEQESPCKDEALNAFAQKIEEYTIAYQKPALEKQIAKTKTSKEKKVKKKGKRYIPLNILSQDDKSGFDTADTDAFYKSLVKSGICQADEQLASTNKSPFEHVNLFSNTMKEKMAELNCTPNLEIDSKPSWAYERNKDTIKTIAVKNIHKDVIKEHLSNTMEEKIELHCTQNVKNDSKQSCADEMNKDKTEDMKSEMGKKDSVETIIIENIPKEVTKEDIENIILGYGEVRNLSIESHGTFLRAKLKMDFVCEVDWVIDCLNESQPFGVFDEGKLKCYKLKD